MTQSDLNRGYGPAALVTGASNGIGRAFAHALAAQGFDLVLVARSAEVLTALATDLTGRYGVAVTVLPCDLGQPGAVADILTLTAGHQIGLLVAAAGFGSAGAFLSRPIGDEVNMVDVNCRSVVELTHGIAQRLVAQKRGGMVLFGSLLGFQGAPYSATYAATKNFIQAFAEGLAVELGPQGVNVLAVAPGPVDTGFGTRAQMRLSQTETPDTVAQVALATLGRRTTIRPGALAKFLGLSLALLPRWARVRVLGRLMQDMAKP